VDLLRVKELAEKEEGQKGNLKIRKGVRAGQGKGGGRNSFTKGKMDVLYNRGFGKSGEEARGDEMKKRSEREMVRRGHMTGENANRSRRISPQHSKNW